MGHPTTDAGQVDMLRGLNAVIGAKMTPPRSEEWVTREYHRKKELRELRKVKHHPGEREAVAWACELAGPESRQTFDATSQSDSVPQRFGEQTGGDKPSQRIETVNTPTAEEIERRKAITPLNCSWDKMAEIVGPGDPMPQIQDSEGWITPEVDAWARRNFPWRYSSYDPTITEFRQMIRGLECEVIDREPSAKAKAVIARRVRGGRRG